MEELNLPPTISRKNSSSAISAISAVGSDYEIESIFALGGLEPYVDFSLFHFYTVLCTGPSSAF